MTITGGVESLRIRFNPLLADTSDIHSSFAGREDVICLQYRYFLEDEFFADTL